MGYPTEKKPSNYCKASLNTKYSRVRRISEISPIQYLFLIAAGALIFFLSPDRPRSLSNDLFGDVICWTESIQDEPPNASNKSRQLDTSRI